MIALLLPAALAYESDPQYLEVEDTAELFSSAEFDSGWLPAGSPIAVKFAVEANGGAWTYMEGLGALSWPEPLTLDFIGEKNTGEIVIDAELAAVTSIQFDIDVYTWESEIDRRSMFVDGIALFDPWVLAGSPSDQEVEVGFEGKPTELITYSVDVFTGVSLEFAADMAPENTTYFRGISWSVADQSMTESGQSMLIDPDGSGLQAIDANFTGEYSSQLDIVFTPTVSVCIPIIGCTELVSFDIPLNLVTETFEQIFPTNEMEFPLPIMDPGIESYDFGELEVGSLANLELPIANVGELTLVGDPQIMGASSFTVYPEHFEASAGYVDGLVVSFAPDAEGPFEATLLLTSNDPFAPTREVQLTGLGFVTSSETGEDGEGGGGMPTVSTELRGCGCASGRGGGRAGLLLAGLGILLVGLRRREGSQVH